MSHHEPLECVVIRTHNRCGRRQALRSALAQSYNNFEIIVVEDDLTEATAVVVGDFGRDMG